MVPEERLSTRNLDILSHFHCLRIVRAARVSKRTRRLFRRQDGPLPYGRGSDSLYTKGENGLEARKPSSQCFRAGRGG